jgi:hypothetical protein
MLNAFPAIFCMFACASNDGKYLKGVVELTIQP